MINEVPTFRVDHMPYGGIKGSGMGREGVQYAIREMTELKMIAIREMDWQTGGPPTRCLPARADGAVRHTGSHRQAAVSPDVLRASAGGPGERR